MSEGNAKLKMLATVAVTAAFRMSVLKVLIMHVCIVHSWSVNQMSVVYVFYNL